jgi:hypothetical protein
VTDTQRESEREIERVGDLIDITYRYRHGERDRENGRYGRQHIHTDADTERERESVTDLIDSLYRYRRCDGHRERE